MANANGTGASITSAGEFTATTAGTATVTATIANGITTGDYTQNFDITVSAPPSFSVNPASKTTAEETEVKFSVAAANYTSLKWQASSDGGSSWSNLNDGDQYSGTTTTELTMKKVFADSHNRKIRCHATGAGGTSAYSGVATLTLIPNITTQPVSKSVVVGFPGVFTVAVTNETNQLYDYHWEQSDNGKDWTDVTAGANRYGELQFNNSWTSEFKTLTTTWDNYTEYDGRKYRCVITNSTNPGGEAVSDVVTLTVTTS